MLKSFRHASEGIVWTIINQQNFRIHLLISLAVVLLAYLLSVTKVEWLILLLLILLGLTVEMINTAVEEVVNLITVRWSAHAKVAKDISAGMMLLTAIGAAFIALVIFVPYLF